MNRFVARQDSILYDHARKLTRDFNGHTYGFDGENHQTSYDNGAAAYFYDGDGRRVKKLSGTIATIYIYDIKGQLVAEYTPSYGSSSQGNSSQTSYLTPDSLGTPRVVTDSTGTVKARHDYLPFGEEITASVGARTASQGYVVDSIRQKFTGHERDNETGLDYAQARYYSSSQGRFTSIDPLRESGKPSLPQSWNRFSYVLNNPLCLVDPNGLSATSPHELGHDIQTQQPEPPPPPPPPQQAGNLQSTVLTNFVNSQLQQADRQYNPFNPPSPTGSIVPGTQTTDYNCMAWALQRTDSWIEPARGGLGGSAVEVNRSQDPPGVTVVRSGNFTPATLPRIYGGRPLGEGQSCPTGTYQLRVFSDSADVQNWHVMRQDSDSTWSSKNGETFRYRNISDPNAFYHIYFQPRGSVTTTDYCMPSTPRRP
jgi:RHS repeat-associated protein